MAITPHPFAIQGAQNFNDGLYNFLAKVEKDVHFVYSDQKGIPTLGIGYALVVYDGKTWVLRKDYQTQLRDSGVSLSPLQLADLETKLTQAMNTLNNIPGFTNPFKLYSENYNPLGWEINSTQSRQLFEKVVPQYEKRVKDWLGNDALYGSLQGSQEMVALFSLSYNGVVNVGKSPKLKQAMLNGDRAEAYYEIRYNSGADPRRFLEGDTFGLYNPDPTEVDYKAAYRMLARHRKKILGADGVGGTDDDFDKKLYADGSGRISLDIAIRWGTSLGISVQSIQDNFTDAYNNLKDTYIDSSWTGITVSWDRIYVGEDQSTLYYKNTDVDVLSGSGSSDLILGESGNDTIDAGNGNDVLYGGTGDDLLKGGVGNDYYVHNTGDGFDTLIDSDGTGNILFNGIKLNGGYKINPTTFRSNDQRFVYRLNTNGSLSTTSGITVDNFTDGNLNLAFTDYSSGVQQVAPYFSTESGTSHNQAVLTGTEGDDRNDPTNPLAGPLLASPVTTLINGLGGNDVIDGKSLSGITLYGGTGNDRIDGGQFWTGEYYLQGDATFRDKYAAYAPLPLL